MRRCSAWQLACVVAAWKLLTVPGCPRCVLAEEFACLGLRVRSAKGGGREGAAVREGALLLARSRGPFVSIVRTLQPVFEPCSRYRSGTSVPFMGLVTNIVSS